MGARAPQQLSPYARYLKKEHGRPGLLNRVKVAKSFHSNFYQHREPTDGISQGIVEARELVAELEDLHQRHVRPFKIQNASGRERSTT